MAERLKPVDVVTIGVGLTGSLMAKELAASGLKVVGLERGAARDTVPDFQSPSIHDELRFAVRKAMMQDNVKEAVTFRNTYDQTALPIRRWTSFLPGTGLGGSFVHWNGQSFRFQVADFIYRTHILERYGRRAEIGAMRLLRLLRTLRLRALRQSEPADDHPADPPEEL